MKEVKELAIPVDPGKALRPLHKQTKFTRKKKLEVIQYLGENWNISRAAQKAGVHPNSIRYLIKNDQQFKEAVETIKNSYLDTMEEAGFSIAVVPTRDSFNDRKLMLQAHRPEIYNPVQKTEVNFTIREENATIEARKILQNLAVENVDYKVIDNKKLNK